MRRLSLKRNIAHSMLANIVFTLCQWGILASLTKMSNPEVVGLFTLSAAIVTPFFFFAAMELRQGLTVDPMTEFKTADYFALRLVNSLIAFMFVFVTVFSLYGELDLADKLTIFSFALVKFLGTQSDINYGVYQRNERMDYVSASLTTRAIAGLIAFSFCFYYTKNLMWSFLAEAAAWLLVLIAMERQFLLRFSVKERFLSTLRRDKRIIIKLFFTMLPLGISSFLINLSINLPKLLTEHYLGLALLGIFGSILYIYSASSFFINAIGRASSARLARLYQNKNLKRFNGLLIKLCFLSGVIGLIALAITVVAGKEILTILYTAEYGAYAHILVIIFVANSIRMVGTPFQFALIAMQKYWTKLTINAAITVITIIAALILIPAHGIEGAAWTVVVTATSRLIASIFIYIVLLRRPLNYIHPT